ncbi:MAG TPA: hypothetical protein VFZ61_21110 [Polyangiales bacterium]
MPRIDRHFAGAPRRALPSLWTLAALSVWACDSQATPRYSGEPLLSLSGTVTTSADITQTDLVPTLAFENSQNDALELVDTQVQGEFPSKFTLRVYAPPPAGAFMQGPAGLRYAIGYIGAATIHHPSSRRKPAGSATSGRCDQEACYIEYEACGEANDAPCYRETRTCDLNRKNCVVTSRSGDLELGTDPWADFAGLSVNYQVLYLEDAVTAASPLAELFAEGAELAAGYHLLEVRAATEAEAEADYACWEEAGADVIDAYNDAHGTSYEDAFYVRDSCATDAKPCDDPAATLERLLEESDALAAERGCGNAEVAYSLVGHPESTSITIEISSDAGPLGDGEGGSSEEEGGSAEEEDGFSEE